MSHAFRLATAPFRWRTPSASDSVFAGAGLAPARDHDGDGRVEDREDIGDLREVPVAAGEPGGPTWIDAVQYAVDDEEKRSEQHEQDDRPKSPCHRDPFLSPAEC